MNAPTPHRDPDIPEDHMSLAELAAVLRCSGTSAARAAARLPRRQLPPGPNGGPPRWVVSVADVAELLHRRTKEAEDYLHRTRDGLDRVRRLYADRLATAG